MRGVVYFVEVVERAANGKERLGPFSDEDEAKDAAFDHYISTLPTGADVNDLHWHLVMGNNGPVASANGRSYAVQRVKE